MISFIIIGKNEGWKLTQCIESIYLTIKESNLNKYEIIYIDSDSDDDSLIRCRKFKEVKAFKLIEKYNPAIARNLGAQMSKGDIFVFLDADMTINSNFLKQVYIKNKLIHPLVAGIAVDRILDRNRQKIREITYHKKEKSHYKLITGGAFIIEKETWESVNGMDNRFVKGADPELGIRLATKGVLLLNINDLFIIHHNDKYKDGNRLTLQALNKNVLFSSMLTYRKNIISKYAWKRLFSNEKSLISLVISVLLSLIYFNAIWMLIYFFVLTVRLRKSNSIKIFIEKFFYYLIRDWVVFFGFFFYYPRDFNTSEIKYKNYSN